MKPAWIAAALAAVSPSLAVAAPEIGKPAPEFAVEDINGKPVKLSDYKDRVVVLEWNNPDCPFVRKHYLGGHMQSLHKEARDKGAVWIMINSAAPGKQGHMDAETARLNKHIIDHYVLDPEGTLGRLYGAKTTPHMFVIDEGTLAYMGAIDDKPTADPKDIEGATNYVRAALDSITAGQPVAVASTQAYGCSVKYVD